MEKIEYRNKVIRYKTFVRKCATKTPPFVRFLKERGLVNAYTRNSRNCIDIIKTGRYDNCSFTTTVMDNVLEELVNHSFIWNRTPEGDDFWRTLDDEWHGIVDEMDERKRQEIINTINSMWNAEK